MENLISGLADAINACVRPAASPARPQRFHLPRITLPELWDECDDIPAFFQAMRHALQDVPEAADYYSGQIKGYTCKAVWTSLRQMNRDLYDRDLAAFIELFHTQVEITLQDPEDTRKRLAYRPLKISAKGPRPSKPLLLPSNKNAHGSRSTRRP